MHHFFLSLLVLIFAGIPEATFAQYTGSNPPCIVNGANCTQTSYTGTISLYWSELTSCGLYTSPINAVRLGSTTAGATGAFSVTYSFSSPVNNIRVLFTGTGAYGTGVNEIFNFTTNGGATTLFTVGSCFATTTGNQLITGAGITDGAGGGGVFRISSASSFTTLTVSGPGAASGSMFSFISSTALPVELTSFEVTPSDDENYVDLFWETENEVNNDKFILEKSSDYQNWNEVATIKGAGTSNETHSYNVRDIDPIVGISYYRLLQKDYDGLIRFKGVQAVNIDIQTDFPFPNPANSMFNLTGDNLDSYSYELIDALGNTVIVPKIVTKKLVSFETNNLANGFYYLHVSSDEIKRTYKIIVEHN
jgi:Secretion system C-terminal sorting domain